jgi:hypothetical protein
MFDDKFKEEVIRCLAKAGWNVIQDPFYVRHNKLSFNIDLEVEKEGETRLIEIKSFLSKGFLEDFYAARGKYQTYQDVLNIKGITTPLYLAVPYQTYQTGFTNPFIQTILVQSNIKLLVYNIRTKRISRWTK